MPTTHPASRACAPAVSVQNNAMPDRHIRDIIRRGKLVTAAADMAVSVAARLMKEARVGALLVMDGDRLTGIFTERDALNRVLAEGLDPARTLLSEVMTHDPDTISSDRPFGHALIMMYDHGYRHMPVVEDGKAVGIVSMRDAAPPELKELEVDIERREHIREILAGRAPKGAVNAVDATRLARLRSGGLGAE